MKGNCLQCGDCCRKFVITVKVDERIQQLIGVHYGKGVEYVAIKINHECPYLIDNLCSIYEERPEACRNHLCNAAQGLEEHYKLFEVGDIL